MLDVIQIGFIGLIGLIGALVALALIFGKRIDRKWEYEAEFHDRWGNEIGEFDIGDSSVDRGELMAACFVGVIGVVAVGVNIALNLALFRYMGHAGLAFATATAALVNAYLLLRALHVAGVYSGDRAVAITAASGSSNGSPLLRKLASASNSGSRP